MTLEQDKRSLATKGYPSEEIDVWVAGYRRAKHMIGEDLLLILNGSEFEIVDHPGYETLREFAEGLILAKAEIED